MKLLKFKNIHSSAIKENFKKALKGYPDLQSHQITVIQRPIPKTTMRAQPVFDRFFFNKKKRRYKIEISNHAKLSEHIKIEELPEDVLLGWLAHEVGHLQDYVHRSARNIIGFGLGYLFFPTFRMGVERKADVFAINAGFANEIVKTKKYILEHSTLPNQYKNRIEKYYLSVDEVAVLQAENPDSVMMDRLI